MKQNKIVEQEVITHWMFDDAGCSYEPVEDYNFWAIEAEKVTCKFCLKELKELRDEIDTALKGRS